MGLVLEKGSRALRFWRSFSRPRTFGGIMWDMGAVEEFQSAVALKFQLYNSLFTSLPFHRIERTGIMLSLLLTFCEDGYKKKQSPVQIIEEFFQKHTSFVNERDRLDVMFRFIQYVERQVVLFDALEDAAF